MGILMYLFTFNFFFPRLINVVEVPFMTSVVKEVCLGNWKSNHGIDLVTHTTIYNNNQFQILMPAMPEKNYGAL